MIATKYHDHLSIFNLLVSPPLKGEEIHILSIINPHFPHSFLSSLLPFFTLPSSNFYFHTPPLIISLLLSLLLAVLHLSSFHSPGLYHPHYSHCFILFLFFFCFFFLFIEAHVRAVLLNYIIMRAEGGRKREEVLNSRGDLSEPVLSVSLTRLGKQKS